MPRANPRSKAAHKTQKKYRQTARGRANRAAYYQTHKTRLKRLSETHRLKACFGISLEEKEALFIAQGSCCAVCKTPNARKWCTDHDHDTNKIRGILCSNCNLALGLVKDSVLVLSALISYLQQER